MQARQNDEYNKGSIFLSMLLDKHRNLCW